MGSLPELTAFDLGVIAIVLVSAVLALARGFVRELMTLLTWGGAVLTAIWLWTPVREIVAGAVAQSLVVDAITAVLVFLVPLIIYKLVASMLVRGVDDSGLSGIDRLLGLVFGVFRGVLVVAAVYLVAVRLVPIEDHPIWVKNAWLLPEVQTAALVLDGMLPAEFAERSLDALEKGAGTIQDLADPRRLLDGQPSGATAEQGYGAASRSAMERLVEQQESE
ncbi:CvpA family protein [Geminicoccus flavidas]|uniref:CvpA family protein n=1 Tax=Geminicoccus flavidas TaxID=2506407 RepID=UPI00135A6A6B|nr:CvpA family protein [Geminicoccus flavidas]